MKKLALILVFILVLGCAFAEPVKVNYMEDVNTISGLGSIALPNVDFSAYSHAAQDSAAEVPAVTEAPAEAAASGSNAAAITILQNAQALLNADPAANAAAVSALIDSVIALLG